MNTKPTDLDEYFRHLNIMFWALLAGQVMFSVIILVLVQSSGPVMETVDELFVFFQAFIILFILASVIGIRMVTNMRLKKVLRIDNLSERMIAYRSNLVIKYALLEAPVFVALVFFLMTADTLLLLLSALLILMFIMHKPDRNKIIEELQISHLDQKSIIY